MSTAGAAAPVRSALYRGTVVHHRSRNPRHRFAAPVAMPLLRLDELEALDRLHPLVDLDLAHEGRSASIMRLRRGDFLEPRDLPLARAVHDAVAGPSGEPGGPVALLGNLRTWGWLFNPLTVYFSLDPAGEHVEGTVLEVSNTPWHERHAYVVGPPGEHRFAKELHVSPFLGMDADYVLGYSTPGDRFHLQLELRPRGGGDGSCEPELRATMDLKREPLTRRALGRLLWRPPLTVGVSFGIYAQALRLARGGAPFHPHPARAGRWPRQR